MKVAVATTTAISQGLNFGRHVSTDETGEDSADGFWSAILKCYFIGNQPRSRAADPAVRAGIGKTTLDAATPMLEFKQQRRMRQLLRRNSKNNVGCGDSSTVIQTAVLLSQFQCWNPNSNAGSGNCYAGIQKTTLHVPTPALQFKHQHCCRNSSAGIQNSNAGSDNCYAGIQKTTLNAATPAL